jgi:hypothetical protein
MRGNQTVVDNALVHLLANFKIWVFADPQVQLGAMRLLGSEVQGRPRKVIGVPRMIDALQFFFCYDLSRQDGVDSVSERDDVLPKLIAPEPTLCASHLAHPNTAEVIGRRATGPALVELRREIWRIISGMLKEGGDLPVAVDALLGYLSHTVNERARCEGLHMLLDVLQDEKKVRQSCCDAWLSPSDLGRVFPARPESNSCCGQADCVKSGGDADLP